MGGVIWTFKDAKPIPHPLLNLDPVESPIYTLVRFPGLGDEV